MKKQSLNITFLSLLLTVLLISNFIIFNSNAQSPVGEILIVDDGGEGDFTSIQSAIDNASNGDKIQIKNGVYYENNIVITKKIIIEGENQDNTIIDCNEKQGFIIGTCCVELSNLKLINTAEFAIRILDGNDNCEIKNTKISNAKNTGIWIQGSETLISECTIKGINQGIGIKLRKSNTVIDQTTVHAFDSGVLILLNSNNHQIKNSVFFDTEKALEIRINSNDNVVKNCDISYNTYGVYIWDDSKNNQIYANNFWKNTVNAYSETVNIWNNETLGNYWDDYEGQSDDSSIIGNSSYIINNNNKDNKPLLRPVSSNVLRKPVSVRVTSFRNDDTPSFTWLPSLYSKEIDGYNVRIDNNPEIFIGNLTTWTSPNSVNNGIHTFYVKTIAEDNSSSDYATVTFVVDTTTNDSDGDGWTDEEEQKYGTDPYDSDNYPLDTDDDKIPDKIDSDDDNDGYPDSMEESYNTNPKDKNSFPDDSDGDKTPNNASSDGLYPGDSDDDNDGLNDILEEKIGSNPYNSNDAKKIYIKGEEYYLVDINQNKIYDILLNPQNEKTYDVDQKNTNYLIDINGDGSWEYIYQTGNDEIQAYRQNIDYKLIIVIAVIVTIITALFLRYYIVTNKKEKTVSKNKKTLTKKTLVDNMELTEDRLQTVNITKNLLYDMQKTVSRYVEQLDEIEKQIKKSETNNDDEEKNQISVKQKTKDEELWKQKIKNDSNKNIDTRVDSILFEKMVEKKIDVSKMDVTKQVDTLLSKHFNSYKK